MTFWLLLLLLPSSMTAPEIRKTDYSALLDSAEQRTVTPGDTGVGRSSSGSHLTLPQNFIWAQANQLTLWKFKYSQSSLPFLMLCLCWFSGLGLPPAGCSRLSWEWLCCKRDQHQTQGTVRQSQLRSPWKRIPALPSPVLAQQGHTLRYVHLSEMPRSTQREVISKWH